MKIKKKVYIYNSIFSNYIRSYLELKQSIGYKYKTPAESLSRFDKMCLKERHLTLKLTSELIQKWIAPREGESPRTKAARISVLRGFADYLRTVGIEVEWPPIFGYSADTLKYIPYIFTHEEIASILRTADALQPPKKRSMFHIIFPAIIRLLYGCGLRVSEALALRIKDVNLKQGVITIRESKFGRSRIVTISTSLQNALGCYVDKIILGIDNNSFFFPTAQGEQYSQRTVYDKFRTVLWDSGISHGGKGKGPRVHDFRHTFAVHSIQQNVLAGRDTYVLLPILATYLGHLKVSTTEQYLRLTAEIYPDFLHRAEALSDWIIPEVQDYEE